MGRYRLIENEEDGETIEVRAAKFSVRGDIVIFLGADGSVVLQLPIDDVKSVERVGD